MQSIQSTLQIRRPSKTPEDSSSVSPVTITSLGIRMSNSNSESDISEIEKRVESLEGTLRQVSSAKRRWLDPTSDGRRRSTMSLEDPSSDDADSESTCHIQPAGSDTNFLNRSSQASRELEGDKRSYALKNTNGAMRFFG